MNLWSVFVTGLFAGGASCASVQGGLLAGAVARRAGRATSGLTAGAAGPSTPKRRSPRRSTSSRANARIRREQARARALARRAALAEAAEAKEQRDVNALVPVGGFLVGKLISHTLFGALLGALGERVQIGFGTRAYMQIGAGVLMFLMAANLLGFTPVRRLVPAPPAALARLVRRSARSQAAVAPALVGFLTVVIPCGVTLSVMFLAITAGSPLGGAALMATFVLGTSPLFTVLGYAVRRSATALREHLATAAAVAVLIAGIWTLNSGLVLRGSSFTLQRAWINFSGSAAVAAEDAPQATVDADGVQQIAIEAHDRSFSPSGVRAAAATPTVLTLRTNGTRGCTRAFVIPSLGLERVLPETGETPIELGELPPGRLDFTCRMGMYPDVIYVT